MSVKIVVRSRVLGALSAAAAATLLSACNSISIQKPAKDEVVVLPFGTTTTSVVVVGNSSYTGLRVTADGNDVSSQMVYQGAGSNRDVGNLTLARGLHTVEASADVPCWYCSGQKTRSTDRTAFCVVSGITTKTTFAQTDSQSWTSTGGVNVSHSQESGKCPTRWWLMAATGGAGTSVGTIQSAEFPGQCLRSPDDNKNSLIVFAPCDNADLRQRWGGNRRQLTGGKGFYSFEHQAPTTQYRCLTRNSSGQLIQTDCDPNSAAQLWAVRHNDLNQFESGPQPFGQ
jgi:hypothetical protein